MKKILSIMMVLSLMMVLSSCGKGNSPSPNPDSESKTEEFTVPKEYSSVLMVTINPQFRLYLDGNENVLAVEAVNEDAKSIANSIALEDKKVEAVIESIITESNKNGFVKADATVSFELVESKLEEQAKTDILSKIKKTADDTADKLKIEINVSINEPKIGTDTESSDSTVSSEPIHTHSFSDATCTQPKTCSCGATDGNALGHNFENGTCTRCGDKDPNYKLTSIFNKNGKWTSKYLLGTELYSVSITLNKPGEYYMGAAIGDLLSTLPSEMQNDPNIKNNCEEYNGQFYFYGKGDGSPLQSVTEEDHIITISDDSGEKLVFTRIDENTLKCSSAPNAFAGMEGISVGSVFTFVNE